MPQGERESKSQHLSFHLVVCISPSNVVPLVFDNKSFQIILHSARVSFYIVRNILMHQLVCSFSQNKSLTKKCGRDKKPIFYSKYCILCCDTNTAVYE